MFFFFLYQLQLRGKFYLLYRRLHTYKKYFIIVYYYYELIGGRDNWYKNEKLIMFTFVSGSFGKSILIILNIMGIRKMIYNIIFIYYRDKSKKKLKINQKYDFVLLRFAIIFLLSHSLTTGVCQETIEQGVWVI